MTTLRDALYALPEGHLVDDGADCWEPIDLMKAMREQGLGERLDDPATLDLERGFIHIHGPGHATLAVVSQEPTKK